MIKSICNKKGSKNYINVVDPYHFNDIGALNY